MEKEGIKKKGVESESTAPELLPGVEWVWEAFISISVTRSRYDDIPQPITHSEILSYAELEGITLLSQRSFLRKAILLMDEVWMEHEISRIQKRREAERDKVNRKAAKGRGKA